MSKEYGYITGKEIEQGFRNNKGIFTPQDIIELDQENKWTNFGQLEFIETQTVSASTTAELTSLQESTYNVHFVTFALNLGGGALTVTLSNDDGSTFETSGYEKAAQYGSVGGTFAEDRSTSNTNIGDFGSASANNMKNGYLYFYNLGDSSKYSFTTYHSMLEHNTLTNFMLFGSSVRTTAEVNNAIRFSTNSASTMTGTVSLYGIRFA
jgi:hypothetical protein